MLKRLIRHGICIKKHMLWLVAALLILMTAAVAANVDVEPPIALNSYGIGAPFLISWSPVWFFAAFGGFGSTFFKIDDIDKHFHSIRLAKAFLGFTGAMALCLLFSTGAEPPRPILSFYAFISAICAAPLLQGLIFVISLPRNQAGLFNAINPFKFKIVTVDDAREVSDDTKY